MSSKEFYDAMLADFAKGHPGSLATFDNQLQCAKQWLKEQPEIANWLWYQLDKSRNGKTPDKLHGDERQIIYNLAQLGMFVVLWQLADLPSLTTPVGEDNG